MQTDLGAPAACRARMRKLPALRRLLEPLKRLRPGTCLPPAWLLARRLLDCLAAPTSVAGLLPAWSLQPATLACTICTASATCAAQIAWIVMWCLLHQTPGTAESCNAHCPAHRQQCACCILPSQRCIRAAWHFASDNKSAQAAEHTARHKVSLQPHLHGRSGGHCAERLAQGHRSCVLAASQRKRLQPGQAGQQNLLCLLEGRHAVHGCLTLRRGPAAHSSAAEGKPTQACTRALQPADTRTLISSTKVVCSCDLTC